MRKISKVVELNQGNLEDVIHKIFPGFSVRSNVRKEVNIKNEGTGYFMEIDVWIPDLALSFEFQDAYHYVPNWASNIPLSEIKRKDKLKREEVLRRKDTLVVIPCWWNGAIESLIATIKSHRPEVLESHTTDTSSYALPIPLNPPLDFFVENDLPFIGNLMLASFPTANFHESISPLNPWWMGEKYDGIRCCWVHPRKKLFSRYGADLELPEPFFQHAPTVTLDGEIWFGRGMFQDSRRIVEADMEDWIYVKNIVFDVPDPSWAGLPFEGRYSHMLSNLTYDNPFFIPAARLIVGQMQRVNSNLNDIIQDGGEGVILRKPKSLYEKGRSNLLLKLKASRGDREALVTDSGENHSLILQLPSGEMFKVKSESVVCSPSPQVGDVVTFSYDHYSRYSLPVDPKVYRIRPDLDWKDVLLSFQEESQAQDLNEVTQKFVRPTTQQKTPGFWKINQFENIKQLFLQFASSRNFDPLVASNWYTVSQSDITALKGGFSALQSFNGSHIRALSLAFPDIGLDAALFEHLPRNYWGSMTNRQNFFIDFAEKHGFDPLIAHNWYSKKNQISQEPKSHSLLVYYNKSPVSALIHVFPDIGLDPNKFDDLPNLFRVPANARNFLDKFAEQGGFDPLISENWYSVSSDDIRRARGGSLLVMYNNSLHKALLELYPDVHFDSIKFDNVSRNYWDSRENKRRFFDEFAKSKQFNPLLPENWYQVSTRMVRKSKSGSSVLHRYGGSLVRALEDVYPELQFDAANFGGLPRFYWFDVDNHRVFFEKFAKDQGFDPLISENWYSVDAGSLIATKGASLLTYYQTFQNAILKNFPELNLNPDKFRQSMKRFAKRGK